MSSLPVTVPAHRQPGLLPAARRRARSSRATQRSPRPRAAAESLQGPSLPSATRVIALLLWGWCWAGLFGLLLFEGLRGSHPVVGWLPFWLLLWPAASLGLMMLRRTEA